MKTRFSRLMAATVTLGALAVPAVAQADPMYYPSGPQRDVPYRTVEDAGWKVCFQDSWQGWHEWYGEYGSLATIKANCDSDHLMLASTDYTSHNWEYDHRENDYKRPAYELLAAAPRADVFHDTGNEATDGSITSNGSQWYFSDSRSWGFANGGDVVNRNPCDSDVDETNPELRMCFNTSAGNIAAGARAGETFDGLQSYHLRTVLEYVGAQATGSPDPVDLGTQAQDTVSTVKTVDWTIDGTEYTRLGELEIVGPDADDFWLVSSDCTYRYVPAGGKGECTAKVRFVPSTQGARQATLRFERNNPSAVELHGTGGPAATGPQGPAGDTGQDGTNGTDGADGTNGTSGTSGTEGAQGDRGPRGLPFKLAKRGKTRVACKVNARGTGSRIVCRFNRRTHRNWLVQMRDRRGALSTARGNRKTTMVFLADRAPRGAMRAFVIRRLRAG